jgi:hypothetical protein
MLDTFGVTNKQNKQNLPEMVKGSCSNRERRIILVTKAGHICKQHFPSDHKKVVEGNLN